MAGGLDRVRAVEALVAEGHLEEVAAHRLAPVAEELLDRVSTIKAPDPSEDSAEVSAEVTMLSESVEDEVSETG